MADNARWAQFSLYGADGMHGADALGVGIERMVTGIASPPDTRRGITARLNYLTRSRAGYAAMDQAGISRRTIAAWTAGTRSPSARSRVKLDAAYWDLRRHRVVTHLKQRLASDGRGTRIEIDPVDQRAVQESHRRDLPVRSTTVRPRIWDAAVDAWLDGDRETMASIWDEIIIDLDSGYDAYTYVSSVGWGA